MTSNKLSKKDQDFAHAMALKLRLNRERLAEEERQRNMSNSLAQLRSKWVTIESCRFRPSPFYPTGTGMGATPLCFF